MHFSQGKAGFEWRRPGPQAWPDCDAAWPLGRVLGAFRPPYEMWTLCCALTPSIDPPRESRTRRLCYWLGPSPPPPHPPRPHPEGPSPGLRTRVRKKRQQLRRGEAACGSELWLPLQRVSSVLAPSCHLGKVSAPYRKYRFNRNHFI